MRSKLPYLMLLGLTMFSSCTVYQLGTLNVANETKTENTDSFVSENDSVKITYSFKGIYAPLKISVENKLNEPIYVNWERSALIFADDSKSLSGDKIDIKGNIDGFIYEDLPSTNFRLDNINQSVNLSSKRPLTTTFVAPNSIVKKTTISLDKKVETEIAHENWGYSYVSYNDGVTGANKVKTVTFNEENSPYKFKSYITIFTASKEDKVKDVLSIQKSFYLAELKNSTISPEKIVQYKDSDGNMFYTRNPRTPTTTLYGSGFPQKNLGTTVTSEK